MIYKQKHPETCLAKCLLVILKKHDKKHKEELKLLIESFKYDRENIARGHLETAVKKYKTKFNWTVDSKVFYEFTKKQKLHKNIRFRNEKIDLKKIESTKKPLILYVDRFYLWKK